MLLECVIVLVTIALVLVGYFKIIFAYWPNRDVPLVGTPTFPFGNLPNLFTNSTTMGVFLKEKYLEVRSRGLKYCGGYAFTTKLYMPVDRKLIAGILQKDFHHFPDRGFYHNEKDDPISANLFALTVEKWKNLRGRLNAAFTPGKLRAMHEQLVGCGKQLQEVVDETREKNLPLEITEAFACYTTDVIGACGFGIKCNSLKNPNAEFLRHGKSVFDLASGFRSIKTAFAFAVPNLAKFLGIMLFTPELNEFFMGVVRDAVKFRKDQTNAKDILQILIESKGIAGEQEVDEEDVKELAAQIFIFFVAGFGTSSSTLAYCLFELTQRADLQEKIKEEIRGVLRKHQGKITYDGVMEMKYLDQVIDETLRKYPATPFLMRMCRKDCVIAERVIEKGVMVGISVMGLHHDPEYFPNPDVFDPERFSVENKGKLTAMTYMPFGEGPRFCIGQRLGLLQTKIALIHLFQNHKYSLNSKTELPIVVQQINLTLSPKSKIYLNILKD